MGGMLRANRRIAPSGDLSYTNTDFCSGTSLAVVCENEGGYERAFGNLY